MEIDGNIKLVLEGFDQLSGSRRVDEAGHIFDGDHVRAERGELFGLLHIVVDSKDFGRDLLARKERTHPVFEGKVRINGVAHRAIS